MNSFNTHEDTLQVCWHLALCFRFWIRWSSFLVWHLNREQFDCDIIVSWRIFCTFLIYMKFLFQIVERYKDSKLEVITFNQVLCIVLYIQRISYLSKNKHVSNDGCLFINCRASTPVYAPKTWSHGLPRARPITQAGKYPHNGLTSSLFCEVNTNVAYFVQVPTWSRWCVPCLCQLWKARWAHRTGTN